MIDDGIVRVDSWGEDCTHLDGHRVAYPVPQLASSMYDLFVCLGSGDGKKWRLNCSFLPPSLLPRCLSLLPSLSIIIIFLEGRAK